MQKQHQVIQLFLVLADALAVAAAWVLAYSFRFFGGVIPVYHGIPPFSLYAILSLIPLTFVGLWMLSRWFGPDRARPGGSLGRLSAGFRELV